MKRSAEGPRLREAVLRRQLWLRTARSALWYLPLVHLGYPCFGGWPWSGRSFPMPAAIRIVGVALIGVGAALTGASVYTLVRYGEGTPAPHDPPQRFVCHGPYRRCRNPMELGNLLTLVGRALHAGSPALGVASALFALTVHAWIVLVEEPYMVRHFGLEYRTYQQHVSRWGWPRRQPIRPGIADGLNQCCCGGAPIEVQPLPSLDTLSAVV